MQNHRSNSITSARARIYALAKSKGVRYQRLADDELAEVVTRLSDDDLATDDVEDLVVALKRSGAISGGEMFGCNRLIGILDINHLRKNKECS